MQLLCSTESRPRKYYYSLLSDSQEVSVAEEVTPALQDVPANSNSTAPSKPKLTEHDLYPILSEYLRDLGVYSKRIDEKRSSNSHGSKGNHWLHPDLVAIEDLGAQWCSEVRECLAVQADKRAKLWSFEVKLLINRSNVRECFFQAVSNSSWANLGYLVASEVTGGTTMKELTMLAAAHGIGIIELNVENPSESQVLIPAREREEIDWEMVNRLTEENDDFVDYLEGVKRFYQTNKLMPKDWD